MPDLINFNPASDDMLEEFLDSSSNPVMEALLAGLATLVIEDPTVITSGILVADGKVSLWPVYFGLLIGIVLGDIALFFIGRWFGPAIERRRWISQSKIERARNLLDRNLIVAIITARLVPGTRMPVFMSAGLFGASAVKFVVIVAIASSIWTTTLFFASIRIGEILLPILGSAKWYAIVVPLVAYLCYRAYKRSEAKHLGAETDEAEAPAP